MPISKISFSGKILCVGPLIKTSFEIPWVAESLSVSGKPALVYTSEPERTPRIDTEISLEQDR